MALSMKMITNVVSIDGISVSERCSYFRVYVFDTNDSTTINENSNEI